MSITIGLPPPIVPPPFPFVPPLPGVPPLLAPLGGLAFAAAEALGADALGLAAGPSPQQWGIYYNGAPAITADTVTDLSFRQEYRISNAPQEQGAFVSFNKVQDPFDGKVTYVTGADVPSRAAMLQQIAAAIVSLDTGYSLVMPEFAWSSVNVTHQGLQRSLQNRTATLLVVDVWVEQVRVVGAAQFSNTTTVNPNSANPQNQGTVQAQPPTTAQNGPIGSTNLGGSAPPAPATPVGS